MQRVILLERGMSFVILRTVNSDSERLNLAHIMPMINGMYPNNQRNLSELEQIIVTSIERVKETKGCELVNWCGDFDLLITEYRIHVILIHKTFEHPRQEDQLLLY
jgi:hypothetical protein